MKYLFALIPLFGYILTSCNSRETKIADIKIKKSVIKEMTIKPTNTKKNSRIIKLDEGNNDTIIGEYRIFYKKVDNNEIIKIGREDKDTLYYANQEIFLTIKNGSENIVFNRKIQRNDFSSFIPKSEINNYYMSNFSINKVSLETLSFLINFCVPDTDNCYFFELIVRNDGNIKINEIIEKESDM